ncbi:hypothetical protein GTA08_BOTSDO04212 [Neofusicoccum parvum]|nr:hypothetical protein GTA08_BOTSDO04212 [Neofusicoccum parvum]
MNVSLCFDAMWPDMNLPVKFNASRSRQEPKLSFDDQRNQLDVNSIAKQLGATADAHTQEDRGVMSLDLESVKKSLDDLRPRQESARESANLLDASSLWFTLYPDYSGAGEDWTFCGDNVVCSYGGTFDTNLSKTLASVQQSVLMRQIMNETHDPALALSAELTMLARMHYYDMSASFNWNQTMATTFFDMKSYPQERRGLAVVLSVVCVHLIVMAVVTVFIPMGLERY